MNGVTINGQPAQAEKYEPCKLPIKSIISMIKAGKWKDSLEEEEILYNIEQGLYTDTAYVLQVVELLKIPSKKVKINGTPLTELEVPNV